MKRTMSMMAAIAGVSVGSTAYAAPVTLYDQDFESPAAYSNDGGDVNIFDTINDNYSGQPPGFAFAQTNTVEILNVSGSDRGAGTAAFGTGWSDPSGTGGDFAVGMLSDRQNDLLGLSFDVGAKPFFNVFVDVSSVDLSTFGGPFVPPGAIPIFRFSLFDNPGGAPSVAGSGVLLDSQDVTGTASARDVFDWTAAGFGLSTAGNTNGNVTLQIDLLQGGYGSFDNLRLFADDVPPPPLVPLPASLPLLAGGLLMVAGIARKRRG